MIQNQEFTYIGKETSLSGTFKFKGATHLRGHLIGDIIVENTAKIVLEIGMIIDARLVLTPYLAI